MPMPISNTDEYNKVVNVSWFTPDKSIDELTLVDILNHDRNLLTRNQVPLCVTVLPNVPTLLHRHPELPQSVLLFL
jgi:hypothetical protein